MLAEISAGFGSLKAALDITKGLNAANVQASINEVKIALQEHIIEAQQALTAANANDAAATQRIRQLEEEVAQTKAWEAEKQRYQLKEFPTGVLAYVLKPDAGNGEPPHRICPNCYQQGHKSILQTIYRGESGEAVDCQRCSKRLILAEARQDDYGHRGTDYF